MGNGQVGDGTLWGDCLASWVLASLLTKASGMWGHKAQLFVSFAIKTNGLALTASAHSAAPGSSAQTQASRGQLSQRPLPSMSRPLTVPVSLLWPRGMLMLYSGGSYQIKAQRGADLPRVTGKG